jgi:hypothetical protein
VASEPAAAAPAAGATSVSPQFAATASPTPPASGAAQAAQGDVGRSAVFFATPTRGGAEVAIDMQGPANQFCHEQGLGSAVYFDTDGRVLRDILCRRS